MKCEDYIMIFYTRTISHVTNILIADSVECRTFYCVAVLLKDLRCSTRSYLEECIHI